jgi:hypothetical protein
MTWTRTPFGGMTTRHPAEAVMPRDRVADILGDLDYVRAATIEEAVQAAESPRLERRARGRGERLMAAWQAEWD